MAAPRLIAPLLVALLLMAVPAADAAKRKVPAEFMGVSWDGPIAYHAPTAIQERQFPKMAAAGVETMRVAFSWDQAQPTRESPIGFTATDRVVGLAAARRIRVFPHIIVAPGWNRWEGSTAPYAPPAEPQLLGPYMKALIGRYGPRGSFWAENPQLPRLPIRHWQFWNEPHLSYQWTLPTRDVVWSETYSWELGFFYRAVKEADPGAKVVLGGLTNFSWRELDELYLHGIRGNFDIAAIHPYTRRPEGTVELVRRFRAVMRRNRDGAKPVFVTEMGLPASRGRSRSRSKLQTTDRGMAQYLERAYGALVAARRRRATQVARVYWYTWASSYRGDIFNYTGLFRYGGKGTPARRRAVGSYVRTARRLEGCAKTTRGGCRR